MFQKDPFIEETLNSLNERIENGTAYVKDHPRSKKTAEALSFMKKRRRILNDAYKIQLSMFLQISDHQAIIEKIAILLKSYVRQNPDETEVYRQQEKTLSQNSTNSFLELMQAYNVFDLDYDFENLSQFFYDADVLLKKTVCYIFSILDGIYPIPSKQKKPLSD